jgi:hypothetical protein
MTDGQRDGAGVPMIIVVWVVNRHTGRVAPPAQGVFQSAEHKIMDSSVPLVSVAHSMAGVEVLLLIAVMLARVGLEIVHPPQAAPPRILKQAPLEAQTRHLLPPAPALTLALARIVCLPQAQEMLVRVKAPIPAPEPLLAHPQLPAQTELQLRVVLLDLPLQRARTRQPAETSPQVVARIAVEQQTEH